MTLTTDYGMGSGFVGTLHAVAFGIAPLLVVIDLDHEIPPHDVRLGALRMERFMRVAPSGVHVGVVDPGVGGERRAVAIEAGRHRFVGPDNGLLTWAADACAASAGAGAEGAGGIGAVVLDKAEYWRQQRSRTFDGRDIFVPVAAQLARGAPLGEVGTEIEPPSLVRLRRPVTRIRSETEADLEVLHVDRFGNVQLSGDAATAATLGLRAGDRLELTPGSRPGGDGAELPAPAAPVGATYAATFSDVGEGTAAVLLDSDGCLALSVNRGRADTMVGAHAGQLMTIRRR
jgi:hypothetical protein